MELMRRRGMMELPSSAPVEVWESVSTKTYTQWYRQNGSLSGGTIIFTPSSPAWTYRFATNAMKYKWSSVSNTVKKVKVEFDYTITGLTGGEDSLRVSVCLINGTNGTTRGAYTTFPYINTNGSGHFSDTLTPVVFEGGTVNSAHYLGCIMYAYAGSGSRFELSNVTVEAAF